MHVPCYFFATSDLLYVWVKATPEAKAIIVTLVIFSIFAWSVMASKAAHLHRLGRHHGPRENGKDHQRHDDGFRFRCGFVPHVEQIGRGKKITRNVHVNAFSPASGRGSGSNDVTSAPQLVKTFH